MHLNEDLEMKKVSPGTFVMGGEIKEALSIARNFSLPAHTVQISCPYEISATLITQETYQRVTNINPSHYQHPNLNPAELPVERVSWFEALEFCNKLSDLYGYQAVYQVTPTQVVNNLNADGFRLPSEAEWAYVARNDVAVTGRDDRLLEEHSSARKTNHSAWYGFYGMRDGGGTARHETTYPVKSNPPNHEGIYQLLGNVREWCYDVFHHDAYQGREDCVDPLETALWPSEGLLSHRVTRGGSFLTNISECHKNARLGLSPLCRARDLGFRVARSFS